nr:hypothetical protein [Tanacetum cinerariifolium]
MKHSTHNKNQYGDHTGIQHKTVSANGLNTRIAEMGQGPLVMLLHGFPELWYSWRQQILYLADHGYRTVAPDLLWVLGDNRPERVKAMVNLSVPVIPWSEKGDIEKMRISYGEENCIKQISTVPAKIGTRLSFEKFLTFRDPEPFIFWAGVGFQHSPRKTPVTLPCWLTEDDVDYFASSLERTGFTRGINYYRA